MRMSKAMWRGISLLLCLLACVAAFAQEKRDVSVLSFSEREAIEGQGVPFHPVKGHALFYFSGGPAAGSLKLIPPLGSDPKALKSELTSLCSGFPQASVNLHVSGAVVLTWNGSRFGLASSSVKLPLLNLSSWMKRHGAISSFVVKTRLGVGLSPSLDSERLSRSWKAVTVKGPKSDLTLLASINQWQIVGLVLLLGWLPVVLAVMHICLAWNFRRQELSGAQRLRVGAKLFVWGHFFAVLPTLPLVIYYLFMGGFEDLGELWLGISAPSPLIGVGLIALFTFLPAGMSLNSWTKSQIKVRESGPPEAGAHRLQGPKYDGLLVATRRRTSLRTWGPLLGLIPFLTALFLGVSGILNVTQAAVFALVSLAPFGLKLLKDPRDEAELPELSEVQSIADSLTRKLKMPRMKVVPEACQVADTDYGPTPEGSLLAVTPSFLQSFSTKEQEYLIAEQLLKQKRGRVTVFEAVVGLLLVFGGTVLLELTLSRILYLPSTFIASVGGLAYLVFKLARSTSDSDSSVKAAILTGDLEAALSAKRKIRKVTPTEEPETEAAFQKELEEFADRVRRRERSDPASDQAG